MTREPIKTRNGYSIFKETDDDGRVHYVVYGPNGMLKAYPTLREAQEEFDRQAGPAERSGGQVFHYHIQHVMIAESWPDP